MTDIPRTLKTFGGVSIQTAKQGDIVRHKGVTMIVQQAYPDGSVRGNWNGRNTVVDHGDWEMVSKADPIREYHEFDNGPATAGEIAEAIRHG